MLGRTNLVLASHAMRHLANDERRTRRAHPIAGSGSSIPGGRIAYRGLQRETPERSLDRLIVPFVVLNEENYVYDTIQPGASQKTSSSNPSAASPLRFQRTRIRNTPSSFWGVGKRLTWKRCLMGRGSPLLCGVAVRCPVPLS